MLKEFAPLDAALAHANAAQLADLERLLPVIGGTVTEVLERYLGEPLRATRIEQRTRACAQPLPALQLDAGRLILERRVLLRGASTAAAVLYADSLIALDRLDPPVKHGLLTTDQPIGRLIRDNRVEVFRELLSCERGCAPHVAQLFGMPPETRLLSRTYRMSNRGVPIMLISEWFPC